MQVRHELRSLFLLKSLLVRLQQMLISLFLMNLFLVDGAGATCAKVVISIKDFAGAGVIHVLFKNMCVQVLHVWWSLKPVCHGHHLWHNSPMRCRSGDMLRRFRLFLLFKILCIAYRLQTTHSPICFAAKDSASGITCKC